MENCLNWCYRVWQSSHNYVLVPCTMCAADERQIWSIHILYSAWVTARLALFQVYPMFVHEWHWMHMCSKSVSNFYFSGHVDDGSQYSIIQQSIITEINHNLDLNHLSATRATLNCLVCTTALGLWDLPRTLQQPSLSRSVFLNPDNWSGTRLPLWHFLKGFTYFHNIIRFKF